MRFRIYILRVQAVQRKALHKFHAATFVVGAAFVRDGTDPDLAVDRAGEMPSAIESIVQS